MLPNEFKMLLDNVKSQQFLEGYIRILNEKERNLFTECCKDVERFEGGVAFATTAFADVFIWDGQYIMLYKLKDNRVEVVSDGYEYFCSDLESGDCLEEFYELDLFEKAKKKLGLIERDECYAFEPLLSLGGIKDAENVTKVHMNEHITLLCQMR